MAFFQGGYGGTQLQVWGDRCPPQDLWFLMILSLRNGTKVKSKIPFKET
jgi:hypothetical protein